MVSQCQDFLLCFRSIMYIYLYPFIHPVDKKFQVRRETEITLFTVMSSSVFAEGELLKMCLGY